MSIVSGVFITTNFGVFFRLIISATIGKVVHARIRKTPIIGLGG
jgi:hypothetical protein